MATRPLTLKAYLAFARGNAAAAHPLTSFTRPGGPLVWAYADTQEQARTLKNIGCRLKNQNPELGMIVCGPSDHSPESFPATDRPREAETYASTLRPNVVLWAGHRLRPALIEAFERNGAYLIALDVKDRPFETPAPRWIPDPSPATLSLFHLSFASSMAALRKLRRLGVSATKIIQTGFLSDAGPPLECPATLHEEVSETLAGRPVWLAAHLRATEAGDVFRAHRQAMRLAHRVLLIIAPASAEDGKDIADAAMAQGLSCAMWDEGAMPEETTQVLLAQDASEMGLWYRVAPLSFLGSSLATGHGGTDPFEAASLGSAILYGPNVGQYLNAYSRLVEAGGARIVRDASSLGTAVQHLIAPDQSAAMAHAGWEVISEGAETVDLLISRIQEQLDNAQNTGNKV